MSGSLHAKAANKDASALTCEPTHSTPLPQVSTVVLTAREGFRRVCLRRELSETEAVRTACLAAPAGVLAALGVATTATASLGGVTRALASPYGQAVLVLCAAAVVELCAEPFHAAASRAGALRLRLGAETAATVARAGVTAACVLARVGQLPLELCFAVAQLVYAATLLAVYALGAWSASTVSMVMPWAAWTSGSEGGIRPPTLALLREFSAQAVWKLALAEGDKAVLLLGGASEEDTGTYGLASNLGALAVRLVLQPLEEAAFTSFASATKHATSRARLAALLRALLLLGCWCAACGPWFAYTAVWCLYGSSWAATRWAAPTVGAYAALLPVLAINGVLEAFTAAVMSTGQVRSNNAVLLASAAMQAGVSLLGLRCFHAGPVALVAGNAAGMAVRIVSALRFIQTQAKPRTRPGLLAALPRAPTLAVIAACAAACAAGDRALRGEGHAVTARALGTHLLIGAACAACALASAAMLERDTVAGVKHALRGG